MKVVNLTLAVLISFILASSIRSRSGELQEQGFLSIQSFERRLQCLSMNTRLWTLQRKRSSRSSFDRTVSFRAHDTHLKSSFWARISLRFSLVSAMWVSHCPRYSEGGNDADCTSPLSCFAEGVPFLDFSSPKYE